MTGDGVNDAPPLEEGRLRHHGLRARPMPPAPPPTSCCFRPACSVVIDATKEARKIFQRMNSYAIYRIAETIRVLFMTLSILVFNFYPVTAVMIVLLALLNDGAILSIAYDRVRDTPTFRER
ncbi:MAG: hypothetical protein R3C49_06235 [Planctomycetaceae bacterium]